MSFPKEGAFAGVNCQVFVKGGPNADLGAAFMNRVLDPKIQQGLAEATIAAPSVGGIEFKPNIAKMLPYPDKKMDEMGLFSPDWAYVNKERPGWIEKMAQIFVA
jgi:putative spermidine/putrescine transport system substrate-binding protein